MSTGAIMLNCQQCYNAKLSTGAIMLNCQQCYNAILSKKTQIVALKATVFGYLEKDFFKRLHKKPIKGIDSLPQTKIFKSLYLCELMM